MDALDAILRSLFIESNRSYEEHLIRQLFAYFPHSALMPRASPASAGGEVLFPAVVPLRAAASSGQSDRPRPETRASEAFKPSPDCS